MKKSIRKNHSKTVAEKAAWSMVENQSQWDLVVINPGWILGPSLTRRTDSASIKTMIEFGNGTFKSGVPDLCFGMVDVRDVAGNIGFHMALDNTKSRESLNIDYGPFEQTVLDHFQQLVNDGLLF